MIRQGLSRVSIPIAFLLLATAAVADQSDKQAKTEGSAQLQLPLVGSTSAGGTFSGTVTLQRIEAQATGMVAIGIVRGTLSGAGLSGASTILVTAVTFPVTVSGANQAASSNSGLAAQQQATTCGVLHLAVGAANLNVLGLTVATMPIGIDVSGDTSSPLGNLVCTALSTLNNVVGLVGLLNQILGALTGLVGGIVPGA